MATTDYYALLSTDDLVTPIGLFRIRRDGGLWIESWADGAWIDGPYTLGRHVYDGEPGAERITLDQAQRLMTALASAPRDAELG